MKRRVCFIHRKRADTPSIERVFGIIANEFEKCGIEVIHARLPYGNGFVGVLLNLLFFRAPQADIFHITGHVHYIALRLSPNKTVLTVHDLGILRNRQGLRRKIIKQLFFEMPLKRLRFITAISDATKLDIVESTNCTPEKITVIKDPIDPMMKGHNRPFDSDKPAVLQMGTAPNKNLDRVIEAVTGLQCRLLIVGDLHNELIERMRECGIEFESYVAQTDGEMREIYQRSDMVVFCSTFEGFGLPIIESQSMGIPLITSDVAPMNDIAGEGAILVNPSDVEQIRTAIETIINDPRLRRDVVLKGKSNIERFKPAKIAGEYLDVYDQIFAENSL